MISKKITQIKYQFDLNSIIIKIKGNNDHTPYVTLSKRQKVLNKRIRKQQVNEEAFTQSSSSKQLLLYLIICTPREYKTPQINKMG